ncbi:MAG TPA: hydrogenase maturation protease [Saprospiraceae bacterium]|jgi:hydrogenase maturation protease|nr:hydrogenase maturation protease [Saprospiraceae bacterium]
MNANAFFSNQTIIMAIGNDARQDDGLGWAFAKAVETDGRFAGRIEYRYQLQVEDAELIAGYDGVLFVDASKSVLFKGFEYQELEPALEFAFSTHALSPASVLALCRQVYERSPEAWLMAIGGEEWELQFGLSAAGGAHLKAALEFFFNRVGAA